MMFFCSKHGLGYHAENWHRFAYRRWWIQHLRRMGTRPKKGAARQPGAIGGGR